MPSKKTSLSIIKTNIWKIVKKHIKHHRELLARNNDLEKYNKSISIIIELYKKSDYIIANLINEKMTYSKILLFFSEKLKNLEKD